MKKLLIFLTLLPILVFSQTVQRPSAGSGGAYEGIVFRPVMGTMTTNTDQWYGVEWDVTSASTTLTKITGDEAYQSSAKVHTDIAYACIKDDKSISYYLNESDFTQKVSGGASDLSGADGQVMCIIPEYYYKYEQDGNTVRFKISHYPLAGYTLAESWAIGLFEGSYSESGDTLCSVADDTATTNKTIVQYRAAAAKRGEDWCQLSYDAYRNLTMLYLVEFANWNSQAAGTLGTGVTDGNSTKWNNYNGYYPVFQTGEHTDQGAYSGSITDSVPDFDGSTYVTQIAYYLGIENIFGHVWKFVDGINIYNAGGGGSRIYTCSNPANFASNDSTNYTFIGRAAQADGYIKTFIYQGIIPKTVGGSSSTYKSDYYYSYYDNDPNSGWRVAFWGGYLHAGASAGLWCASFHDSSGSDIPQLGARLCLKF